MAEIRIGISGWRYAPWRGKFYPEGLRQKDELAYAASRFSSIEVNGTFYSLQRPESFAAWHDATPDDFVFAVKGARYITHMLKLKNVERPLANFFAQGLLALKAKLGPVLWQLPPNFVFHPEKLAAFFQASETVGNPEPQAEKLEGLRKRAFSGSPTEPQTWEQVVSWTSGSSRDR